MTPQTFFSGMEPISHSFIHIHSKKGTVRTVSSLPWKQPLHWTCYCAAHWAHYQLLFFICGSWAWAKYSCQAPRESVLSLNTTGQTTGSRLEEVKVRHKSYGQKMKLEWKNNLQVCFNLKKEKRGFTCYFTQMCFHSTISTKLSPFSSICSPITSQPRNRV